MAVKTVKPASEKQLDLIVRVAPEKQTAGMPDWAIDTLNDVMNGNDVVMSDASALIDELFAAPKVKTPQQTALTEGIYIAPDQTIIKVQKSKSTGNLYCKTAVAISGERLTLSGDVVKFSYEYAPGLIKHVRADMRMDEDQAEQFSIKFGVCAWCGRHLKAAKSVKQGIGPVCIKRFQ